MIEQEPMATPVTTPSLTVATSSFEELQTRSCEAIEGSTDALNGSVSFTATVLSPSANVTLCGVSSPDGVGSGSGSELPPPSSGSIIPPGSQRGKQNRSHQQLRNRH